MILVSYDIANDKLRRRFSKYICKFGRRLQYSVYEIKNSDHILENIRVDLKNKFEREFSQSDSVIIFKMSNTCKIERYGYAINDEEDFIMIK
ncbi:MAG: CRISPR-associated endonuclease Cas2 [Eubacteriales bacterium]|nr:CRISPR-associated endonuclease Cas2 [Eubacteriales bacterium]MDY3332743.1 CRISPR-associated endonuclease Cas2 [Gallibacter sp.]